MKDNLWLENVVLITGIHKTGTTLLKDLIDGHPEIVVYPCEPRFLELYHQLYKNKEDLIIKWKLDSPNLLHDIHPDIKSILKDRNGYIEIRKKIWDINIPGKIEGDKDGIITKKFSFSNYFFALNNHLKENFYSFKDIMYAAIKGVVSALDLDTRRLKMWVFKDVVSGNLDWFFKMFLNGKAIFIIRDPRAFYLSFSTSNKSRNTNNILDIIRIIQSYKERTNMLINLYNIYGKDRIKLIFYEELVDNTSKVIREICDFLKINYSPIMERPTRFGYPICVSTATHREGNIVYKHAIEKWRKELSLKEKLCIEITIGKFFQVLPYSSTFNFSLISLLGRLVDILFYSLKGLKNKAKKL